MAIRPQTLDTRRATFEAALAVIEQRSSEPLTVDDVAAELFVSRRQLQRVFDEHGPDSFRGVLRRVRMAKAAAQLRTSSRTVREIARDVGYLQAAQFAKAFRRHYGMAPAEYRIACRQAMAGGAPLAAPAQHAAA